MHASTMLYGTIRPLLPAGKPECLTPWSNKYDGPGEVWPHERLTVRHPYDPRRPHDLHRYEIQLSHLAYDLLYPWPTDIRTNHPAYGARRVRKLNNNSYIISFDLPKYTHSEESSVFYLILALASERKCRGDWNEATKQVRQCRNIFDVVSAACILHLEDAILHLFLHLFPSYARLNKSVMSDYRTNNFMAQLALACVNHPLFPRQTAAEMMNRIRDFLQIGQAAWEDIRHSNTQIAEQMTDVAQVWHTTISILGTKK